MPRSPRDLVRVFGVTVMIVSGCAGSGSTSPTSVGEVDGAAPLLPSAESVRSRATLIADCLRRNGFEVSIEADGSVSFDQGGRSSDEVAKVNAACAKEVAPTNAPAELSDDDLRILYDNAVQQIDCLAGEGYEVAWATTLETFSEQWKAGNPHLPYAALVEQYPSINQNELFRLGGVCPQFQS